MAESFIEVDNFSYWVARERVLDRISLSIERHTITAIEGPSGSGKSMLLRSINRTQNAGRRGRHEGDIRIRGFSIYDRHMDLTAVRRRVGTLFEKPTPFPGSVFENAVYPLRASGVRDHAFLEVAAERALRRAGLWEQVRDRLDAGAFQLGFSMQQQLCLARAISHDPDILLLDNPFAYLDVTASARFESLLRPMASHCTIIFVTGDRSVAARTADREVWLRNGSLVDDTGGAQGD